MNAVNDLMQRAMALHRSGDAQGAAALYRRVVAKAPRLADAHHLLGLTLHQTGRHRQASQSIARAIALNPRAAPFHGNLGLVLHADGQAEAALASFEQALAIDPGYHAARLNLAVALADGGRYDLALPHYRTLLREVPEMPGLQARLAETLRHLGQLEEAADCYRAALSETADDPDLYAALASTLHLMGDEETALEAYAEVLRLRPGFVSARINLATILRDLGRPEEALAAYEQARRDDPDALTAIAGEANTYERMAQPERAWQVLSPYLAAHGGNPSIAIARASLAGRFEPVEVVAAELDRLSARTDLPRQQRQQVLFAQARLLQREERFDEALVAYSAANALTQTGFDREAHAARCAAIRQGYQAPAALETSGSDSRRPVFIVGMPRSGTSLVEEILASHADVHGAGELPTLPSLTVTAPLAPIYPDAARLGRAELAVAAGHYLQRLQALDPHARHVTDKLPGNFQHLGLIRQLFPQARIVHIARDPMDTCLSCYCQNFGERLTFSADFADLGAFYGEYLRMMAHWRASLPDGFLELRYEDLVSDTEHWSRALVEYCGLPWDPACLRFHESGRFVRTASYQQVRRPIYRDSIGGWRRYGAAIEPLRRALIAAGAEIAG